MGRDDPQFTALGPPKLFCDLTQSWSEVGGGVRTYLLHKRRHILEQTPHRHLMIIPGTKDEVIEEDRAITVRIASPKVPASPHYRLLLRSRAVRAALAHFQPDLIECQDAYNLPWAAIGHRKRFPNTALVAAYMALNTLEKLYVALRDLEPRIELEPEVMERARVPLERMLEMAGRTVGQGDVGKPIIDEPERIDPAISGD